MPPNEKVVAVENTHRLLTYFSAEMGFAWPNGLGPEKIANAPETPQTPSIPARQKPRWGSVRISLPPNPSSWSDRFVHGRATGR